MKCRKRLSTRWADGREAISIMGNYGSMRRTNPRIQNDGKTSVKVPQPRTQKKYQIDLLFDGNRYTPTPESRAILQIAGAGVGDL